MMQPSHHREIPPVLRHLPAIEIGNLAEPGPRRPRKRAQRGRVIRGANGIRVEGVGIGLGVDQQRIVLAVERPPDRGRSVIDPGDLIQQPIGAEDLVEQQARVGGGMPIQVQVQAAGGGEQAVH
jgi:hypothetical protein